MPSPGKRHSSFKKKTNKDSTSVASAFVWSWPWRHLDLRAAFRCCCPRTTKASLWSRVRRRTARPRREGNAAVLPHSCTSLPRQCQWMDPRSTHTHTHSRVKPFTCAIPPWNSQCHSLEAFLCHFLYFSYFCLCCVYRAVSVLDIWCTNVKVSARLVRAPDQVGWPSFMSLCVMGAVDTVDMKWHLHRNCLMLWRRSSF